MGRRSIHVSTFASVIFFVLANGISDRVISFESDKRPRRIFDSYARDVNLCFEATDRMRYRRQPNGQFLLMGTMQYTLEQHVGWQAIASLLTSNSKPTFNTIELTPDGAAFSAL